MQLVKCMLVREKGYDYSGQITHAEKAVDWVKEHLENADRESLYLLCVDGGGKVTYGSIIAQGTNNACPVGIKEIYKTALLCNANKILLVHNHPSGHLCASQQDLDVAKRLIEAGKIMELHLLDSIIVSHQGVYSIRENYPKMWR